MMATNDDFDARLDEVLATARELGFRRGLSHAAKVASERGAATVATAIRREESFADLRTLANTPEQGCAKAKGTHP